MAKPESSVKAIFTFALRAASIFALTLIAWTFLIRSYTVVPASVGNRILHLTGTDHVTSLGASSDPAYDIAVFHRDAAGTSDSLFDFRIEALRTDIPMVLALILAMPLPWRRRLIALLFGVLVIIGAESVAAVLVMTRSYLFLPDHQKFSPFHFGNILPPIIDFLYKAYNEFGPAVIPILTWMVVSVRSHDLHPSPPKSRK
jgi:hypothetical protein